jgi:hypothetical protein
MKKGNIDDIGLASMILLFVSITFIFGLGFFGEFNNYIQATNNTQIGNSTMKTFTDDYNNKLTWAFDYGFLFLALGFLIFSFIQAKRIPTSTEYYILAIIMVIFTWIISIIMAGFYNKMVETSSFLANIASGLVVIPFLMPKMLYYALIYTFLVGYALYTK